MMHKDRCHCLFKIFTEKKHCNDASNCYIHQVHPNAIFPPVSYTHLYYIIIYNANGYKVIFIYKIMNVLPQKF